MQKTFTKVCALCLAASMVLPAGQVMAEGIQKEDLAEYAVFSEDSQAGMLEGDSELSNLEGGESKPEGTQEKADTGKQQPSERESHKEAEVNNTELNEEQPPLPDAKDQPEVTGGPETLSVSSGQAEPEEGDQTTSKDGGKTEKQEEYVTSSNASENEVSGLPDEDGRRNDFYATVNAGVLSKHPEDNWSYFEDLDNKAHAQERKIVQEAGKETKAGKAAESSSEYRIGSLYNLAMNQKGRNKYSVRDYNRLMKPLMKAKTVNSFLDACAKLQKAYGLDGILNTEVVADEYGDSGKYVVQMNKLNYGVEPEDFLYQDAKEENQYYFNNYLKKLLVLTGKTNNEAKKASGQVYKFLKKVAKTRKAGRPAKVTVGELEKKAPRLHINRYLKKVYGKTPEVVYASETNTLRTLNKYLTKKNLPLLKNYVYLMNLKELSPYMTSKMARENMKMEEDYIGDVAKKSRKTVAAEQTAGLLRWDIAEIYTKNNFDESEKAKIQEIVTSLIREYETMLREEDWITDATKEKAINKLKQISIRTGMPSNAADYLSNYRPKGGKKGGSYLFNVLAVRGESIQKKNRLLSRPVDRNLWETLPQEMNPCYYPTSNAIYIPVAALESPYFSVKASREKNFGAIGVILGHEITHAFDDLGSQYDEVGRFGDWWTAKDRKAFESRAEKIVTYYTNYKTPGVMDVDGRQTLGENIADLGAMRCVSRIVEREKLSAEKFFESFANTWASKIDDLSAAVTAGADEHAPDKVRVNAVLSCTELFYKTYGIREGDKMYVKPENRVALWGSNGETKQHMDGCLDEYFDGPMGEEDGGFDEGLQEDEPERKEFGNLKSFQADQLGGGRFTQEDFNKHDVTVVNFWSTLCGPCIDELSMIAEFAEKLPENDRF